MQACVSRPLMLPLLLLLLPLLLLLTVGLMVNPVSALSEPVLDSNSSRRFEQQILFPSQGDLLLGRVENLNANSTCGEDIPIRVCPIGGEPCFTCDSRRSHDKSTSKDSYRLENAVGKIHNANSTYRTWWLSQPGVENVAIELNLEMKFTFTHLIMIFRGYRPKAWYLERSSDYGASYKPYAFFAEKCTETFPGVPTGKRQNINDVVCSSAYTDLTPSDKGQVVFNTVPQHIMELDTFSRTDQSLWRIQTEITNLRIHLVRYHTLTDDKLDGADRRYYYGLYEMNVHGMCICNGHATMCKPAEGINKNEGNMVHGQCECMHNTQGPNCEQCLDFYNDRKWAPATQTDSNECRRCQCHGHTDRCAFSQSQWDRTGGQSGGQCLDCRHNTTGDHCEKCEAGFYRDDRKTMEDPDVCVACDCFKPGIREAFCEQETNKVKSLIAGQCFCKPHVAGRRCDRCQPGFWNLQANNSDGCIKCGCVLEGTIGNEGCNQYTGQCPCKINVEGETCNRCKPGFYNLSMSEAGCEPCNCDIGGSLSKYCDASTGNCKCKLGFEGRRCDKLSSEFYVPRFDMEGRVIDIADSQDSSRFPRVTRPEEATLTGKHGLRLKSPTQRTPDSLNIPLASQTVGLPTGTYIIAVKLYPMNVSRLLSLPTLLISGIAASASNSNCSQRQPIDDFIMRVPSTADFLRQQQLTGPLEPSAKSRPYAVLPAMKPICIDANGLESLRIDVSSLTPADDIIIDAVLVMRNFDSPISTLLNRTEHIPGRGVFQPQPVSSDTTKAMETSLYNCLDYWKLEQQVATRMSEDCRQLVQSLSSYQLAGAMRCSCSPKGTISKSGNELFDCEKLGGQCPCLPNVVRRTCSECAANHYGFGQFPNEGCRPCDCSQLGSISTQCDSITGDCICRTAQISGRRCDSCRQGFWEFPVCRECQCNGLAADCDKLSGVCLDCRNNTGGRECQDCSQGFYGDPKRRIPCRPCRCPGGRDGTVQHAATCQLKSETPPTPVCNCLPGYIGDSCERCDVNYYGDPSTGVCTRCSCNGNINFSVPNSCDPNNGMCTKCLNYTTGVSCELCQQGFYGQASVGRCQPCMCNPLGTDPSKALSKPVQYSADGSTTTAITHTCDGSTGQCSCLPNVEGTNCDACKPRHYNLTSGSGCTPCDCDPIGSANDMCNVITGQCPCRSNRAGRRCDQCLDLYFGDPSRGRDGCQPCDCHPEGSLTPRCDKVTGRCICKSAVTGRRCDACERGTTGTMPNCTTCGECWYNWDKIIAGQHAKAQELKSRADWAAQTGNMAGDLGAIVNETDRDLRKMWRSINQTQVSVDQVTDVQNRLNYLRDRLDRSSIDQQAQDLSKQLNVTEEVGILRMRAMTDSSMQSHLIAKRRMEAISRQLGSSPRLAQPEELLAWLTHNGSRFDSAVTDFDDFNKTIAQLVKAELNTNAGELANVTDLVLAVNTTALNQTDSIKRIYKSIEEKLPELNRIMCVGHNGENASLYSRSRSYCSELCGGPSADVCRAGLIEAPCAEASVCDKSVVAQLRSVAASTLLLNDRINKLFDEYINITVDPPTLRFDHLNAASLDTELKVAALKSEYANLTNNAKQLEAGLNRFLATNGSTVEDIRKLIDSIQRAASVFSDSEVADLSSRLTSLLEKLPMEHNVTKINQDASQARDDVARLTRQSNSVLTETEQLGAKAGDLTEQLSAAQAGVEPSKAALSSAGRALDDLNSSAVRMSGVVSTFDQLTREVGASSDSLQARRAASQRAALEERVARLREEQQGTAKDLTAMDQRLADALAAAASGTSGGRAVEISPAELLRRQAVIDQLRHRARTALIRMGSDQGLIAALNEKTTVIEQSMESALARIAALTARLNADESQPGSLAKISAQLERAKCKARN